MNNENNEISDAHKKYNTNLISSLDDIQKLAFELKKLSEDNKNSYDIVSNILDELDSAYKKLKNIEEE